MMERLLNLGFKFNLRRFTWVLTKARRRATKARAFRLMTRMLQKTLSLALSTWADNVKELMRVRDGLQKLVTRRRWGRAYIARLVIQPILDHLVQRTLNPRVLGQPSGFRVDSRRSGGRVASAGRSQSYGQNDPYHKP